MCTSSKVMLLFGLLLLIADDLPNSFLATGDFCSSKIHHSKLINANITSLESVYDGGPCYMKVLTIYDIFQMMGLIGTVLILLFIRNQYTRIEEVRISV